MENNIYKDRLYGLDPTKVKDCCKELAFNWVKSNVLDWYNVESQIRNNDEIVDLLKEHRSRAIHIISERNKRNYYRGDCQKDYLEDRYSLDFFNEKIHELTNNYQVAHINNSSTQQPVPNQAHLALFFYYLWKVDETVIFDNGMVNGYKEIIKQHPHLNSWKHFQGHFQKMVKVCNRLHIANKDNILSVIVMLNKYPKALHLANDELKIIITKEGKPLT